MSIQYPFVSLVLPVRNEEKYIDTCLQALVSQDYPHEKFEILIADGQSTDRTRDLIEKYKSAFPNLFIFDNPGLIVPTGLNILIREAKGQFIIRVDGHTVIAPDYVMQCVWHLTHSGVDNVGGRMTAIGSNAFGKAVAAATSVPFGIGNARFHYSEIEEFVDTVYLGAWPIQVFKNIGLFDEELVRDQDDEFNYRLRSSGGKILLSPKIKSYYTVRSSPVSLWKQYFQYGFWKIRVLQKHPKQMSLRQFVPFLFVSSIILSLILTLLFEWGWLFLISFLGFYLVANLLASVATLRKYKLEKKPLSLLPLAFSIIHTGYGFGFLLGLFHFWNRWKDKEGLVPLFSGN